MKKYRSTSIFKPFKIWRYLFKKPVSKPMNQIFTQKNADQLNSDRLIKSKSLKNSSPRVAPDNVRGFHTNDWELCIGCGTCEDICPTKAIVMVERQELPEEEGKFQVRPAIDYGRCCFCALCVDTCTTQSLNMSKEYIYANDDPDKFFFLPTETFQGEKVEMGWQKDEVSNLLDPKRIEMDTIEPDERINSFVEMVRGYSKEYAMLEAARCVECGVCTMSCPVQMHIPAYIKAIWEDDIEGGLRQIYETNPLPGVCGRVCTHNCETSCAIAVRGEAIAIRWLKRYIIDSAPNDMYKNIILEPVSEVINAKVAIVGAGPAGLGAAYYLRVMGYQVDVFEEMPLAGGVMRYGIAAYRLPDTAIDKDIDFIKEIGVNIKTNTRVGKDVSMEQLEKEYDAVFLGTGFFKPRSLNIPGADHKDVIGAMDFLPKVREYDRGNIKLEDFDVAESIVVIGGGDVAFDVARSAVRLQMLKYGKVDVKLSSLEAEDALPADIEEYVEGKEEGIKFFCANGPQEIVQKNGKVAGVRLLKVLSIFDSEGRFNPQYDEDQELILDGKQVYIAIGQAPDYNYIPKGLQDKINFVRGKIDADTMTGQLKDVPWLFVGGDILRGPDLISGVADGHRAAKGIDEYLYKLAKDKEQYKKVSEMRDAVKFNNPNLTFKQRR